MTPSPSSLPVDQSSHGRTPRPRTGPLAGLRVADFCWMGVGALATRLLADFGADVIKIEGRNRIDLPRRLPIYKGDRLRAYGDEDSAPDPEKGGLFNNFNRNKLGVTINLRLPEGRQLAERLIATSSVVSENFAPGVMENWGLTYGRLRELVPEVIYARMSGFGHTGPHASYRSYGPVVQAVSGLSHISGLPGQEPSGWGLSYMDNMAAYFNSAGLLLAVLQRQRTGRGTEIDVSAVEAGIGLLGPLLLDAEVNHRSTRRPDYPPGNRLEHPPAAPHGVYPSRGEDEWVAIAVFNDDEWDRLVAALGQPAWTADPRFGSQPSRHAHQDPLDEHLSAWTRDRLRHETMDLLQAAGVRAAAVQNARDLTTTDPQVAAHGLFFELDHPVIGPALFEGVPFLASSFTPDHWRSAPLMGEDNAYVFKTFVGLADDEYDGLVERGVIE